MQVVGMKQTEHMQSWASQSDGGVEERCCTGQERFPVSVFVVLGLFEQELRWMSVAGGEDGQADPE